MALRGIPRRCGKAPGRGACGAIPSAADASIKFAHRFVVQSQAQPGQDYRTEEKRQGTWQRLPECEVAVLDPGVVEVYEGIVHHVEGIGYVPQEFAHPGGDFVGGLARRPEKTSRGKATTAQNVSYSPFIHKFSLPPMRGTDSRATTHRLHIQKAPRICTGLNTRESSRPAENANIRRSEPPTIFSSVMANPTQMSPSGPQTANAASPHPARKTTTERALVESLRMKKAYRIFPAYSKTATSSGR